MSSSSGSEEVAPDLAGADHSGDSAEDPAELRARRAERRAELKQRIYELVQELEEEIAPLDDRGHEYAEDIFAFLCGALGEAVGRRGAISFLPQFAHHSENRLVLIFRRGVRRGADMIRGSNRFQRLGQTGLWGAPYAPLGPRVPEITPEH